MFKKHFVSVFCFLFPSISGGLTSMFVLAVDGQRYLPWTVFDRSRPIASRAQPQAPHYVSGVFTVRVNKSAYHLQFGNLWEILMEGSHKSSTGSALDIFLHLRQMLISEYDN
jgi:hypothetical protein